MGILINLLSFDRQYMDIGQHRKIVDVILVKTASRIQVDGIIRLDKSQHLNLKPFNNGRKTNNQEISEKRF